MITVKHLNLNAGQYEIKEERFPRGVRKFMISLETNEIVAKVCNTCEEMKTLDNYCIDRHKKFLGLHHICKSCDNIARSERYQL